MAKLQGLYSVPTGTPFADSLVRGMIDAWGHDPLAFAAITVFLPTRRACRSLQEAFLDLSEGRALALPRLVPLGDFADEGPESIEPLSEGAEGLGEIPPAMPALERQLILARLIRQWEKRQRAATEGSEPLADEHALRLAAELARLIDQTETENLDLANLDGLVPDDYARHWQDTLAFLRIVRDWWPEIEAESRTIGPARRYARLVERRIAAWRAHPPEDPVFVAGSTGSVPATRRLIGAVLSLPRGTVVLPGLDSYADEALWSEMARDPTHPQFGLAELLRDLGKSREDVLTWPGNSETGSFRAEPSDLVATAMVPAQETARWPEIAATIPEAGISEALDRIRRLDCTDPGEEGRVIALTMREVLEEAGRTAALVTPDRALARRVAGELKRWQVKVDDSAGMPLGQTVPGNFLRLLAQAAVSAWAPLPLLALLKHPLSAGGLSPGRFRSLARRLELAVLRGVRPQPGLAGIERLLADSHAESEILDWFSGLVSRLVSIEAAFRDGAAPLDILARRHLETAEALAESDREPGPDRIWHGEAGEALAGFFSEVLSAHGTTSVTDPLAYPGILDALMEGRVVRPRHGLHPRLTILGPLEARLQKFDRLILGGLNEGVWPAAEEPGPWLSRPMREAFGLPSPERRIGLAAHDFLQAFSAREVILTRAQRAEGSPTVPSRWLLRFDALTSLLSQPSVAASKSSPFRGWSEGLDRPESVRASPRPEPRPPFAARPRRLSVTQIETWMRDPYALYARHILGLKPLDPVDADPGLAERGSMIHGALEAFIRTYPTEPPDDAEKAIIAIGHDQFRPIADRPGLWSFWWPRFLRVAAWVAGLDVGQRRDIERSWAEVTGRLTIEVPRGQFELYAKADRIDRLRAGGYRILDYKTGRVPSKAEVESGPACQLPLEAAILLAGGFAELEASRIDEVLFWKLTGGEPAGEVRPVEVDPAKLADSALERMKELVTTFDDPQTPYLPEPLAHLAPRYNDYRHLSRIREWASGFSEDGP